MKKMLRNIKEIPAGTAQADFEGAEAETPTSNDEQKAPVVEKEIIEVPHAEPGDLQAAKSAVKGHGEQTVIPDDCQFGDNDLCYVET